MNNIRFISVSCSYPTASSVVFSRNWKFGSFAGLSELSRIFKLCKSLDSVEQVYLSPTGKRILNYQKNNRSGIWQARISFSVFCEVSIAHLFPNLYFALNLQIHHMLHWIRNAFTTLAMEDYPYPTDSLPGHPVNVACEMMATASSKLEGLAGATALVYNGTNGTLSCLDPDTEYIECADPTGCGLGPDSLAWDYQVLSKAKKFVSTNRMIPCDWLSNLQDSINWKKRLMNSVKIRAYGKAGIRNRSQKRKRKRNRNRNLNWDWETGKHWNQVPIPVWE